MSITSKHYLLTCLSKGCPEVPYLNIRRQCATQAHSQILFKPLSAFLPIQFRPNPPPFFWSPLKASVDKLTGKLTISKFQIRLSCTIYISSPIIRFPQHKATARRPYTPLFKKFSSRKIRSRLLANFHFVLMREATRRNLLEKDCNALCRLRRN